MSGHLYESCVTTNASSFSVYGNGDAANQLAVAQTFTPSTTHILKSVKFYLSKIGTPSHLLYVALESMSGGSPTGTALDSATVLPTSIGSSPSLIEITFNGNYQLQAGTTYAITFHAYGGSSDQFLVSGQNSNVYANGKCLTLAAESWSDFGYDTTFYEYGPAITYTLTYSAGAHGSISGTTPQTVDEGSSGSAVTAVADAGYHFKQWSDSSTDNPRTDSNISGNISVTANFEAYPVAYPGGLFFCMG